MHLLKLGVTSTAVGLHVRYLCYRTDIKTSLTQAIQCTVYGMKTCKAVQVGLVRISKFPGTGVAATTTCTLGYHLTNYDSGITLRMYWRSTDNKGLQPGSEKAAVAALDRHKSHRSVTRCVHMDMV